MDFSRICVSGWNPNTTASVIASCLKLRGTEQGSGIFYVCSKWCLISACFTEGSGERAGMIDGNKQPVAYRANQGYCNTIKRVWYLPHLHWKQNF